jgi:Yip1 domain
MSEMGVQPATMAGGAAEAPSLTQWQRIVYTFTAPSKTFEDIRRGNKSWWLPLIIGSLFSYILFGAVVQRIGIQQVVDNQIRLNPKAAEQLAQAPPDRRELSNKISVIATEAAFLGGPVLGMIGVSIFSLGLWGTMNFIFGGKSKFTTIFPVFYYGWLPQAIKAILGTIVIYAGMAPESFNVKNFSPTNLGAFLDPADTNKALYTLATSLDAVTIWSLVLLSIGAATVAGTKRSSGYIAVFGWWAIFVLIGVAWAAAFG